MASVASTSNTVPLSWCDLPSDLFEQILRRLPSCKDGVHVSAVCRHWRACAQQHFPRRQALPMRVTRTAHGTHVVHVRGFSWLQERHLPLCRPPRSPEVEQEQPCVGGFVDSPTFTVAGLDWAIRYYPGSDDDGERGSVGVFVRLLTEGAVAWAYVQLLVLDQAIGVADKVIWDDECGPSTLVDAVSADSCDSCARGARRLAARSDLKGFVRDDCLKIECAIHVFSQDPMLNTDSPLILAFAGDLRWHPLIN